MRVEAGNDTLLDAYTMAAKSEIGRSLGSRANAGLQFAEATLARREATDSVVVSLSRQGVSMERSAGDTAGRTAQQGDGLIDNLLQSIGEYYDLKRERIRIKVAAETTLNQENIVLRAAERRLASSGILAAS